MICKRGKHNIDFNLLGIKPEQLIILSIAGSNMYGTTTESSDIDYLGIYIPTLKQLKTTEFKHHLSLPKSSGLDLQIWSIHYFLKLAMQGETMTIDLLHAPYDCWAYYNPDAWNKLVECRKYFYTKEMKSYVGFAKSQAIKYGVKGNKLNILKKVVDFLNMHDENKKLKDVWMDLPVGDYINFHIDESPFMLYEVCGKRFHSTVKISYIKDNLKKILTEYGRRAIQAANNEGIDWKGLSHAVRACEQVYWILKFGDYRYPLVNSKFITEVKKGNLPFYMIDAVLTDWMDEIEKLIKSSKLPLNCLLDKEKLILNFIDNYAIKE
jgi:hypothetical protein